MKLIKHILLSLLLFPVLSSGQIDGKKWFGHTRLSLSLYEPGSYAKERPTFYLEQGFYYEINSKLTAGGGIGINAYPGLLGLPVFLEARFNFPVKKYPAYLFQSYGRNLNVGELFFASNRNWGGFGILFNLNENLALSPEIGYAYIWDAYGGKALHFNLGIGLTFGLSRQE